MANILLKVVIRRLIATHRCVKRWLRSLIYRSKGSSTSHIASLPLADKITTLFNEIRSWFVPQKMRYEITGKCKMCGKCCNYMYSYDTYTEKEFKIMQFFFPTYRRFYIKGKDEEGNLIFACKLVTPEGKCSVYKKRPRVCRKYPAKFIAYPGKLHEGCGYKVNIKTFEDYLK